MANLSQIKRQRMLEFLNKMKEEHKEDDSALIAINEIESELNDKKYGLVWEEHQEQVDVEMLTKVPVFSEIKEREIVSDENLPYNFLLEGDNLHSLKLLEKTHKGKIDVIYIDPPYNTGNKDFVYDDLMVGLDDGFRHSKWLSFMYNRLNIAKSLLNRTGILFVSIDDNEQATLKMLLESIFEENNFIGQMIWQKKKGGGNDSKHLATEHEYIYMFAKNKAELPNIFIEYGDEYISRYKEVDEKGRYFWDTFKRKSGKQYYAITCPDGTVLEKDENGEPISWLRSEARLLSDLEEGEARIIKVNGKWTVHFKQRQPDGYKPRSIIREYGTTSDGAFDLKNIFNITNAFSNPKPIKLVKYLLKFVPNKSATVLDFFAGSGTTAQAVMELNAEDNGNRKFILCTNNENSICEDITYQRIKTVITGKRKDGSDYSDGISANLKYYKTDFIDKTSEDEEYSVDDELLKHIAEMVQLEYAVRLDGKNYVLVLSDKEADDFIADKERLSECHAVYISASVLLTAEQQRKLKDNKITAFVIPDYYFENELLEVGER